MSRPVQVNMIRPALKRLLSDGREVAVAVARQVVPERYLGKPGSTRAVDYRTVLDGLRRAPARPLPADLGTRLRIIASRESQRRRERRSWLDVARLWREELHFRFTSLAKPFAIPTAGGVVSAVLMFGILGPSLQVPGTVAKADVPTGLYTEASVKSFMPLGYAEEDLIIEVTVDGRGRVVDHSYLPGDQAVSPALRKQIENYLLFTEFEPATSFGQPRSGRLRFSIQSSRIIVKG